MYMREKRSREWPHPSHTPVTKSAEHSPERRGMTGHKEASVLSCGEDNACCPRERDIVVIMSNMDLLALSKPVPPDSQP